MNEMVLPPTESSSMFQTRISVIEPLEPRTLLAATYYVSPSGNNAATGRSPAAAWRSIDRVNGKDLMPGDRVLFQAGHPFTAPAAKGANLLSNPNFTSGLS